MAEKRISGYTYVPAVIGNLLGSITLLICIEREREELSDWWIGMYGLNSLDSLSSGNFTLYLLQQRIGQIALFVLLSAIATYPVAAAGFNLVWGWFYGLVSAGLVFRFGWRGALLGGACFFPQFLLYFLAVGLGAKWRERPGKNADSGQKLQYFLHFLVIFFLCALALYWELRVQKKFLFPYFQDLV